MMMTVELGKEKEETINCGGVEKLAACSNLLRQRFDLLELLTRVREIPR
jgi:hypothetical protein